MLYRLETSRFSLSSNSCVVMVLTPRGATFLGGSLALFVAGLLKIDGAFITLGITGLLILILTLVIGRWNLARLHLQLKAPSQVFADTPFDLQIIQTNERRFLDAYGIEIELSLSSIAKIHCHAPWTAVGSSSSAQLRGSIPKRGAISDHFTLLRSTFPLHLYQHQVRSTLRHEILVFPKSIVPREFFESGVLDDTWSGEGHRAGNAPGEPRGLRPYRPGDQAKHLHWPSTIRSLARGRSPRIREYDPPGMRPAEATVLFHSFGSDHTLIRTDLFERALSLACGTLRHLRENGIPTTLKADFLDWKPKQTSHADAWAETLTLLARAKRSESTEAHDVITAIESIPEMHAIIMISDMPPDSWQYLSPQKKTFVINIHQHTYKKRGLNFNPSIPAPKAIST